MDALARRGRVFANAHCAVPVCSASRISVLSGVAPTTHGSYELGPRYEELPSLLEVPTMHGYFRQHGYTTISGGKVLHHGFQGRLAADIDQSLGRPMNPSPPRPLHRPSHWHRAWDWGPFPVDDEAMGDYQLAVQAARLLREEGFDSPFLMSVGFYRPHVPLCVPAHWFDDYPIEHVRLARIVEDDLSDVPPNFRDLNRFLAAPTHAEVLAADCERELTQAYLASIRFVDHCVGKLVEALDSGPYADHTYIVLWSDHGFHLGEKWHWGKRTLWEESTRVPLLIVGPEIVPGEPCIEPVSLLDIYPTLVELCQLSPNHWLEGESLVPQLRDPHAVRHRPAIISSYYGNHAVRDRDWRLIVYEDGGEELYDHRSDPQELHNVVHDPLFRAVRERLMAWLPREAAPEFKAESERKGSGAEF